MLNERFAVRPASSVDAHRSAKGDDLAAILSVHQARTVANDYTVQYEGRRLQIERRSVTTGLRGGRVIIEKRLDGSLRLRFRDRYLRWHQTRPPLPRSPRPGGGRDAAARRPPGHPPALRPPRPTVPRRITPGADPSRKSGHFRFAQNRTFLLCVDRRNRST